MTGKKFVICDIEATGLHEERDLIEIALITVQDGKILEVYETLINPLSTIPEYISDLTSITNKALESAPKFYDVADSIRMRLEGAVFVSHNTDFDLGLLRKKYREMGQEIKVKSFCTLKVAQHEIPGLKNYNLDALCSFFGIKIEKRHSALGDAKATFELFKELFELRLKTRQVERYLPHHEKALKKISQRPGLLVFKNAQGRPVRFEASFNMEKRARELLLVKPDHRKLLDETDDVTGEVTGSALIAEFKKLLFESVKFNWVIALNDRGPEKFFQIKPLKKGVRGLWYFDDYFDARNKLQHLKKSLKTQKFIYREGGKSKEEIIQHNQKVEQLSREARFPAENLVLVGEGRTKEELSVVLIRSNHVMGYGYTLKSEEEIFQNPEACLQKRFFHHLGVDLVARHYIRTLKNVRVKNESWRSLAEL